MGPELGSLEGPIEIVQRLGRGLIRSANASNSSRGTGITHEGWGLGCLYTNLKSCVKTSDYDRLA